MSLSLSLRFSTFREIDSQRLCRNAMPTVLVCHTRILRSPVLTAMSDQVVKLAKQPTFRNLQLWNFQLKGVWRIGEKATLKLFSSFLFNAKPS